MTACDSCARVESIDVDVEGSVLSFDRGRMHLVIDKRTEKTMSLAKDFVASGYTLLCISRYHPDILRSMWGEGDFEFIWLSERGTDHSVSGSSLDGIREAADSFLARNEKGIVVLEGIEYLSLFNDFSKLQIFVEQLNEISMERRAVLLISVDPRLFDQRSLARLRRFAEVVC
ncbi:MAG: DUF835 domain-containing protein [Methanomassiliicoccales archaeon]